MPRRLKPEALFDRPSQTPLEGWSESANQLNSNTVAPSPPTVFRTQISHRGQIGRDSAHILDEKGPN